MKKENSEKLLQVRMQESLLEKFKEKCNKKYKKFSEVVREMIVKYVEEE
jgi:metal-responsive CopG/Arc/MetJ family transcriptional regulator